MIYIHIPFCRSFCTYCGFYSELAVAKSASFSEALCKEISLRGKEISDEVKTLYIGGGTPSVLPLSVFEDILKALDECGHGGPYDEFTVEVNPEDIVEKGVGYVEGLRRLGVNRISMGIQSFDDGILKFMNRRHDSAAASRAYAILEEAGIDNISIDLIFGLPQLSDVLWQETLDKALSISPSGRLPRHMSSYQLSVDPESMLCNMVERGLWSEASDELCERQYLMLCDTLRKAGYNHYEISNFALPGYEARHNSAYWRHVPYTGFGPGAHSFSCTDASGKPCMRRWNEPDLVRYIDDLTGNQGGEVLTGEQLVLERIMLALRTSEGIQESYLRKHCDNDALKRALAAGHLVPVAADDAVSSRLRIPESHFFISDAIISDIV